MESAKCFLGRAVKLAFCVVTMTCCVVKMTCCVVVMIDRVCRKDDSARQLRRDVWEDQVGAQPDFRSTIKSGDDRVVKSCCKNDMMCSNDDTVCSKND